MENAPSGEHVLQFLDAASRNRWTFRVECSGSIYFGMMDAIGLLHLVHTMELLGIHWDRLTTYILGCDVIETNHSGSSIIPTASPFWYGRLQWSRIQLFEFPNDSNGFQINERIGMVRMAGYGRKSGNCKGLSHADHCNHSSHSQHSHHTNHFIHLQSIGVIGDWQCWPHTISSICNPLESLGFDNVDHTRAVDSYPMAVTPPTWNKNKGNAVWGRIHTCRR